MLEPSRLHVELLYASGVRDFDRYRVDASVPLASDFFVPDDDVPPPGVTVSRLGSLLHDGRHEPKPDGIV